MTLRGKRSAARGAALAMAAASAACAQSIAQTPHPNSIQPETTLSISAEADVKREPDIAFISAGVRTEAETAAAAVRENAERMNGVVEALRDAGVAERDMQTSNFSVQPRYDYSRDRTPPRLIGYLATNQITAKVDDLGNLGATIDALVEAGGNTFNGVRFALEDESEARDEARRLAIADALSRADLYAEATGLSVKRIVTISENVSYRGPRPIAVARAAALEADTTPIAAGEVGYTATVNVTFELDQ